MDSCTQSAESKHANNHGVWTKYRKMHKITMYTRSPHRLQTKQPVEPARFPPAASPPSKHMQSPAPALQPPIRRHRFHLSAGILAKAPGTFCC